MLGLGSEAQRHLVHVDAQPHVARRGARGAQQRGQTRHGQVVCGVGGRVGECHELLRHLVRVRVRVGVRVRVRVGVGVRLRVRVRVGIGVRVRVRAGVGVRVGPTPNQRPGRTRRAESP